MIRSITLSGPPDWHILTHASLAYVKILTVKREGQRQYPVTSAPTGTDANFYHNPGTGQLIWSIDRKFNRIWIEETSQYILEKVHVMFEE